MSQALHPAQIALLNSQQALPKLAQLFVIAAVAVTVWDMRRRTRTALKRLDPHELRDIGLTRSQAIQEASKGFWLS